MGNGDCNKGFRGGGGPWRNAVYTNVKYTAPKPLAHFLGCYKDNGSRDFAHGPKQYGYTSAKCMDKCKQYKFVALQNGGWCSCDNSYSTPAGTYPRMGNGDCNKGFRGGGGPWRNAVYTNVKYTAPKPLAHFLGCYKDNGSRDFAHGPKQYG